MDTFSALEGFRLLWGHHLHRLEFVEVSDGRPEFDIAFKLSEENGLGWALGRVQENNSQKSVVKTS
jgi:hypothetical protein